MRIKRDPITSLEEITAIGWSQESAELLFANRNDRRLSRFFVNFRKPGFRKTKKSNIPYFMRKQVLERDAYRCQTRGCGDWHDLHIDHVIPESRGGPTIVENLQVLCQKCNLKKGNRI